MSITGDDGGSASLADVNGALPPADATRVTVAWSLPLSLAAGQVLNHSQRGTRSRLIRSLLSGT